MNPTNIPKEKLYSTAYSPMYHTYVGIKHAHQDDRGEWIFRCILAGRPDMNTILFRKEELENFVL